MFSFYYQTIIEKIDHNSWLEQFPNQIDVKKLTKDESGDTRVTLKAIKLEITCEKIPLFKGGMGDLKLRITSP
ncbi:MAG: hypothetical protein HQM11_03865 [SAR324 cluster bacterium]|nr:hypothetical protein [SAR324 cluster bacterium]